MLDSFGISMLQTKPAYMFFDNCYKEGYENGVRDATSGKSKSYTGFPKAKVIISGRCYDTYVEGYDKGYSDGMRKKHQIHR